MEKGFEFEKFFTKDSDIIQEFYEKLSDFFQIKKKSPTF